MKRKRTRVHGFGGDIGNTLMNNVLPVTAGLLVGGLLTKNVSFLSSNPTTSGIVKIAAGIVIAGQGGFLTGLGIGVAAGGAAHFVAPMLKLDGIGLLPPGNPSRYVAGLGEVFPTGDAVNVTI